MIVVNDCLIFECQSDRKGGLPGSDNGQAITAGDQYSCALRDEDQGQVVCWGHRDEEHDTPPTGLVVRQAPDTLWLHEKTDTIASDAIAFQVPPPITAIHATQEVLPEGGTATVIVRLAGLDRSRVINVKTVFEDVKADVVLSPEQLFFDEQRSSALLTVSVPDNPHPQGAAIPFYLSFGSTASSLALTIPPNDLKVHVEQVALLDNANKQKEATLGVDGIRGRKNLAAFSSDLRIERIISGDGLAIVTPGQTSFAVRLTFKDGTVTVSYTHLTLPTILLV